MYYKLSSLTVLQAPWRHCILFCFHFTRQVCSKCSFGFYDCNNITDTYRYEVHFQKGLDCGGAYIKLLSNYDGLRLVSVFFMTLLWLGILLSLCSELFAWILVKRLLVDLLQIHQTVHTLSCWYDFPSFYSILLYSTWINSEISLSFIAYQSQFSDGTPYTIMFGPDKCGDSRKVHFIFRHRNPVTGAYEEKHARQSNVDLSDYFNDNKPHLYTLRESWLERMRESEGERGRAHFVYKPKPERRPSDEVLM